MAEEWFKFLDDNNTGGYTDFKWPLPNGKPTEWLECEGGLELCKNGFHLIKKHYLLDWLSDSLYVAEFEGDLTTCLKQEITKIRMYKFSPENLKRPLDQRLVRPPGNCVNK